MSAATSLAILLAELLERHDPDRAQSAPHQESLERRRELPALLRPHRLSRGDAS